jgi:hypothetical protein
MTGCARPFVNLLASRVVAFAGRQSLATGRNGDRDSRDLLFVRRLAELEVARISLRVRLAEREHGRKGCDGAHTSNEIS